jgi:hypothetical protein
MKKLARMFAAGIVLLMSALTGAEAADRKPYEREELEQFSAKVESIDHAGRVLVLVDPDGTRETFVLGPEVRNFERIQAGDRVVLSYYAGIAVQIRPRGTKLHDATGAVATDRARPGEKPSIGVGGAVAATVRIVSIDTSFNTVEFKRADGSTRVVAVKDPEAQKFLRQLKPGDEVEVMYTEAVAVSVEPASSSG